MGRLTLGPDRCSNTVQVGGAGGRDVGATRGTSETGRAAEWPIGGPADLFFSGDDPVPRPTMVRGEGIPLWDADGRRYIDVSSGPVATNLGHGNDRVARAMQEQFARLAFAYP